MTKYRPYQFIKDTYPNIGPISSYMTLLMPKSHCPESTPKRGRMDNSSWFEWSFLVIRAMTMTIDSNSILLVCVASAGQYEVFEHVQKEHVPSTNNLHSCLSALRTCSYRVCRTTYMLYSSRFLLYTTSFVHVHFRRCHTVLSHMYVAYVCNILGKITHR